MEEQMTEIKFGTDGWRAIIAEDYTFDNVRLAAQGVAEYLMAEGKAGDGLVIGYDTRFASEDFALSAGEVVAANGIKVYLAQAAAPTPVISFSILDKRAAGAIMVTASHNPPQWNGLKYKPEYGGSASPEIVEKIEAKIEKIQAEGGKVKRLAAVEAQGSGLLEYFDPGPAYFKQIAKLVDLEKIKNAGLRLVADSMYGAGSGYFSRLLAGGKTQIIELHSERNPFFGGLHPEPIPPHVNELMAKVPRLGADAGLALDGDADRIGLVDEKGNFINQLQVYGLLFLYLLEIRGWRGPAVKTITTTSMATRLGKMFDVPVYETPVGFKYVGPLMIEKDAILGGEESGGFGFRGHIPERDGLLAGLFLVDMILSYGKPLSEILSYLQAKAGPSYYNRYDLRLPVEQYTEIRDKILPRFVERRPGELAGQKVTELQTTDGYKFHLEDGSWLLIRFSGTEPLLRVYSEAKSPQEVEEVLRSGKRLIGVE